jgi:hypothetical protein
MMGLVSHLLLYLLHHWWAAFNAVMGNPGVILVDIWDPKVLSGFLPDLSQRVSCKQTDPPGYTGELSLSDILLGQKQHPELMCFSFVSFLNY